MHHIFHIKILCDDKVVSPVIHLLHTVVQMCTVRPWGALFPSDSIPRKVVELDPSIGGVCGEYSPIHLSELVGKSPLKAFGRDKVEAR